MNPLHVKCPKKANKCSPWLGMGIGWTENNHDDSSHGDGSVLKLDCGDGGTTLKTY